MSHVNRYYSPYYLLHTEGIIVIIYQELHRKWCHQNCCLNNLIASSRTKTYGLKRLNVKFEQKNCNFGWRKVLHFVTKGNIRDCVCVVGGGGGCWWLGARLSLILRSWKTKDNLMISAACFQFLAASLCRFHFVLKFKCFRFACKSQNLLVYDIYTWRAW